MTSRSKSRGIFPDYCFRSVVDITPAWLAGLGVNGLLLDMDNTITRWEERSVPPEQLNWLQLVKDSGIGLRLLSNGLPHKLAAVERQTGIEHVEGRPMKPFPTAFLLGLRELQLAPAQVMMVGDSVVTDIMIANRLGLWTCLVDPLSPVDFPGSKLHRMCERWLKLRRTLHAENDYRGAQPSGG
jgi:uncharacterized protein